jgi:hypothetical protein
MRFLANENFPGAAVTALEAAGHDVVWVRIAAPGTTDPDVLAWAAREGGKNSCQRCPAEMPYGHGERLLAIFFAVPRRLWFLMTHEAVASVFEIWLHGNCLAQAQDGSWATAMERNQLKNYVGLLQQRKVGAGLVALAAVWSLAKYLRRVALMRLRLLSQEAKPR